MQNSHHRVGVLLSRDHANGLVMVRVKLGAGAWVDFNHFVALKGAFQLAKRRFCALANLLWRDILDRQASFQAVQHRQQAVCKTFDRKLASLRNFFIGAAACVLHVSLSAKVLVCQSRILSFDVGQFGLGVSQRI